MTVADVVTGAIEVLTDNFIAIGIVGVSLYIKDYLPSMKQKTE